MKPGGTPAFRAAASSILRSFLNIAETTAAQTAQENSLGTDSDPVSVKKRHLIITGSRRSGKSTLLREILTLPDFPADTISSEISESLRNPCLRRLLSARILPAGVSRIAKTYLRHSVFAWSSRIPPADVSRLYNTCFQTGSR